MIVFYHKNCADGIMAAAIANYWFRKARFAKVTNIPIQYDEKVPFEYIGQEENVLILDFSLELEDMRKLLKITKKVKWIDHHITAIKKYEGFEHNLDGLRSVDRSGAYLTWNFLAPDLPVPRGVEFIDDHDRHAGLFEDSDIFRLGMLLYSNMNPANEKFWDLVLENDEKELTRILDAGRILEANSEMWRKFAKGYSIEFEGLRFLVMNRPGNSKAFKYIDDGTYDGLMSWHFNGTKYIYTIYRGKLGRKKGVNMSDIAAKWGGGGHPGAAGFASTSPLAVPIEAEKPNT
jgi:oligoribonuclease NrnB/cAMP/cGMP phosphodiesterase (DHH superfamily)